MTRTITRSSATTFHGQSRPSRALSENGVFSFSHRHELAAGVVPSRCGRAWLDASHLAAVVGVPNADVIKAHPTPSRAGFDVPSHFEFPKDSVLVKTRRCRMTVSQPARRIEPQLLHFDGYQWQLHYRWNDDQTDGTLIPSEGDEAALTVPTGRARRQCTLH